MLRYLVCIIHRKMILYKRYIDDRGEWHIQKWQAWIAKSIDREG